MESEMHGSAGDPKPWWTLPTPPALPDTPQPTAELIQEFRDRYAGPPIEGEPRLEIPRDLIDHVVDTYLPEFHGELLRVVRAGLRQFGEVTGAEILRANIRREPEYLGHVLRPDEDLRRLDVSSLYEE